MGLLPLAIGIANVAVIYWTGMQTEPIERNLRTTEQLESAISELNLLGTELVKPASRQRVISQWRQRRASVAAHLERLDASDQHALQLLTSVRHGFAEIDQLLQRLVAGWADLDASLERRPSTVIALNLMLTQVQTKLRDVLDSTTRLHRQQHERNHVLQESGASYVVGTAVVSAVLGAWLAIVMGWRIRNGFRLLQQGTEVVAAGNLAHRINTATRDELGDLARAFDSMNDRLGAVTASRDELDREMAERRRAEAEAREHAARFRATFEQAAVGIAHVGLDGRWLRVNDKLCQIVGYSRDELLRLTFQDITHPQDLDTDLDHVRQVLDGKIPGYGMEKRYIHKRGDVVWIQLTVSLVRNADGTPRYFISVVDDISARKAADAALAKSEARFRATVLAAPFPIMVHAEDGEVLTLNAAWSQSTGYGQDELPTVSAWLERAHAGPADIPRGSYDLAERQNLGESIIRTRDGGGRTWQFSAAPLGRLADGRRAVITMAVDVTERVLAEQALQALNDNLELKVLDRTRELRESNAALEAAMDELKTAQERLIQQEKLSALGTVVAGVAHELNNPLMGILNYVQYARDQVEDAGVRNTLGKADREIQRITGIVRNMLSFSRAGASITGRVDPRTSLDQALELVAADLRKHGIAVDLELPDALPEVAAAGDALQQVFLNLLINARDALKNSAQRRLCVRARQAEGRVLIDVADSGPGVPTEAVRRIFDPFFTTKPPGEGTGLGLSVSQNLLAGFGGTLDYAPSPEGGATFTVGLPVA
jgi:PAS domain S-box-containing protein